MLEPIKHILAMQRIVLASSSPRREEILKKAGLKFEVCSSKYEEDLNPKLYKCPSDFVIDTAYHKVMEVSGRLKDGPNPPDLIIGADTIVTLDETIFGKPKSKEGACETLQKLSGKEHIVYTGVVLVTKTDIVKFFESTKVFFAELSSAVIKAYIETGDPMDKAGAYGIQGIGGSLVQKIDGDYFNVMGLPLHSLCKHILALHENKNVPVS